MLYIVCEDSGTGFQFWKNFNRLILDSKAMVIHTGEDRVGGISKASKKVKKLTLTAADAVFMCIDNGDLGSIRQMEEIKQDAKDRQYRLLELHITL